MELERDVNSQWGPTTITVFVCDHCGAEAGEQSALNWLRVGLTGLAAPQLGGTLQLLLTERTFCSPVHASEWLATISD